MRGRFVAGNQAALFRAADLRKDNEERREGKSTEESRNCETANKLVKWEMGREALRGGSPPNATNHHANISQLGRMG